MFGAGSEIHSGTVVVITGASDGIGKATAEEFARRHSKLVLIARSEEKLLQVARECEKLGADVMCIPLDVNDAAGVEAAVENVVTAFGRIDVWINNAGICAIGLFGKVPLEEHKRVIETNLFGSLNCAYAVMKVFKSQQSGTLINVGSILSRVSIPKLFAYNTSKFAVRGLSHAMRQDLALEGYKDIHVCQLNPGMVDTDVFGRAGNFDGLPMKLKVPKTTPEHVALKMLKLVERPRREAFVGPFSLIGTIGYTLLPGVAGAFSAWLANHFLFGKPEPKVSLRMK